MRTTAGCLILPCLSRGVYSEVMTLHQSCRISSNGPPGVPQGVREWKRQQHQPKKAKIQSAKVATTALPCPTADGRHKHAAIKIDSVEICLNMCQAMPLLSGVQFRCSICSEEDNLPTLSNLYLSPSKFALQV